MIQVLRPNRTKSVPITVAMIETAPRIKGKSTYWISPGNRRLPRSMAAIAVTA